MESDHVGINALFQPKGKKGEGKRKKGKGRGDSGQEESKKGKGKAQKHDYNNSNGKSTDKDITCYLCWEKGHRTTQCPQRTACAVDADDDESICASSASASACRSTGASHGSASISRIGATTPITDELYSDDDGVPALVFMVGGAMATHWPENGGRQEDGTTTDKSLDWQWSDRALLPYRIGRVTTAGMPPAR